MRAKERRGRHAEAQRKHAASLRAQKIPRRADLARALLDAACRDVALIQSVNIESADADLWRRLMSGALAELARRGFDLKHSRKRMMGALRPKPGSPGAEGDEEGDDACPSGNETAISV
ncbi:hypothetical protein [Dongia sedimenti]|uniref:Uncharacterized protein n=1 Tax=Dongia sedimenti TaxID=3064282 RepID=A0ABU0YU90_9PROT|nr:hypothetical protein [Rhodospirillaceae bacterium R-7]